MRCELCKKQVKNWKGDDAVCAFEKSELFSNSNWNCATVNKIRDLCGLWGENENNIPVHFCEDQQLAVLIIDEADVDCRNDDDFIPAWLLVSWYKRRGKTDSMYLVGCDGEIEIPTEKDLLQIIKYYSK